ncbi:MAG: hypothetical protein NT169_02125 [Chloroflexi bacterium]|nr:hypothetical protein [Chloroflexota bacterium]
MSTPAVFSGDVPEMNTRLRWPTGVRSLDCLDNCQPLVHSSHQPSGPRRRLRPQRLAGQGERFLEFGRGLALVAQNGHIQGLQRVLAGRTRADQDQVGVSLGDFFDVGILLAAGIRQLGRIRFELGQFRLDLRVLAHQKRCAGKAVTRS